MSLDDNTPSKLLNSSIHSGKPRNRFPDARMLVSCIVVRFDEVSSDLSCVEDVTDVLELELEEPVDNPGTTIGTKFCVLHWMLSHLGLKCGF